MTDRSVSEFSQPTSAGIQFHTRTKCVTTGPAPNSQLGMFCFSSRAERQSSLLGSPKTENPTPNPNAGDDKRRATSEIDENAPAVRTNFTHKTAIWSTRAAVGVNGPSEKDFHAVSYARGEQPAYVLKCVAYAVEFFFFCCCCCRVLLLLLLIFVRCAYVTRERAQRRA